MTMNEQCTSPVMANVTSKTRFSRFFNIAQASFKFKSFQFNYLFDVLAPVAQRRFSQNAKVKIFF